MKKFEVEDLTKIFGRSPVKGLELVRQGKEKEEILKETGMTVGVNRASFSVDSGEVFVIMGLSGSGKSTLVRLLNRLIEPTEGSVKLDGEDITKMNSEQLREARRTKMGMVFQRFALFPHKSVCENVEYGLEIQGVPKQERNKKALESLGLVGLENYADSYPDQLSGGMQQRVGLARALANDPDILLMDEAFSALDPLIRKDMQDELMDLQSSMQKTIIFITHDLDEALRIGDRIALMKDGKIVQIGTPEDILTNPANEYVEKFVEDVNLTKVLTASSIMKRSEALVLGKDGPRVALKRMREKGTSTVMVVGRDRTFLGVLTAEGAKEVAENGKSIEDVLIKDAVVVEEDTPVSDLLPKMAENQFAYPAVVTNEQGKLRGVVVRGAMFAALAGNGVNNDATS
ncbi:glycine betaine/L-proline ABC transporter ATP-binding protein ProV [Melghirimyces algeriensis]|uniref:Quaternary amine transport ATP-binding protein n=1 Tax=Melghirimyces algeriensis TaxID=910412 RepID=A0A521AEE2_9BACL|nr:glycine betaine/L-proline ABC transporter ATP-binding protein ProV [Melghirimyces algeriensis]SMO33159.1 glycine betaine/proline transport system ATP-binding protein [Melghirimyces algeriensis]